MNGLELLLEYIYMPLAIALYALHVEVVRLKASLRDYEKFKDDIYIKMNQLLQDVHYLVTTKKEELNK